MKDLLGGKGANLAEMTTRAEPAGAAGLHHHHRRLPGLHAGGWPAGLDEEVADQVAGLEKQMGRALGDPDDPLLVSVRSGAKFSMPGMMDTVLNLGLNDEPVEGLAQAPTTSASPTTPTAGSSRCTAGSCSASTASCSSTPSSRPRIGSAPRPTPTSRRRLQQLCERYKEVVGARPASRSRRTR